VAAVAGRVCTPAVGLLCGGQPRRGHRAHRVLPAVRLPLVICAGSPAPVATFGASPL